MIKSGKMPFLSPNKRPSSSKNKVDRCDKCGNPSSYVDKNGNRLCDKCYNEN